MRVLLAIDGSAHSRAALAEVASRPWPATTLIEILTVVHSSTPMAIDPAFIIAAIHVDQVDKQRHHASMLVHAAAEQVRQSAPRLDVTTKTLEGHPASVIVEEATAWSADLIVLGSHGHGRLRRVVLGSVAGAVVANAPCSVQVVRATHLLDDSDSRVPVETPA